MGHELEGHLGKMLPCLKETMNGGGGPKHHKESGNPHHNVLMDSFLSVELLMTA